MVIQNEKKIAVICSSDHHLKKSELLNSKFESKLSLISLYSSQITKRSFVGQKKYFKQLASNYYYFIFFTMHPNRITLELYKQIRQQKKKIIIFQETHQFSMHHGDVNNLILQGDLIYAASDFEKSILEDLTDKRITTVKSYKWIFNPINPSPVSSKIDQSNNNKKFNLLILSAPDTITASSFENESFRLNLIKAIFKKYPHHELVIKTHPSETSLFKKRLLRKFSKKINFIVSSDHYSFFKDNAEIIFVSNKTQALIDLIPSYKLIVYMLGEENKLIYDSNNLFKKFEIDGLRFTDLRNNQNLSVIAEKLLNYNLNVFKKIEDEILEVVNYQENNFNDEIKLWELVNKNYKFNSFIEFSNPVNKMLNMILNSNDSINIDFERMNEIGLSIKTAISILYFRNVFTKKEINKNNILKNLDHIYTRWFVQYFPMDAIILRIRINKNSIGYKFPNGVLNLVENFELLLKKKSLYFSILLDILKWSSAGNKSRFKEVIFKIAESAYDKFFMHPRY